jgi:zinc protease
MLRTNHWLRAGALAAALVVNTCATADPIQIPFDKFQLANGLTVVVHEDHKAPVVAVSVWYHVGSKDERAGKTGFAHLFEHLMFQASENHKDEYFRPFELAGATDMNGTTSYDRTNYYETVPTTALDMALWMESDRMGHLLGAIDQAVLDEQRGVVQNEKRQGENEPYGKVAEQIQRASFPEGHPYRWETIGSMEDLNAASLDDVKQWFAEHYGAANTTLVLAGDIDTKTAKEKMQHFFGDVQPGPPITRHKSWIAARSESTRDTMEDRVAQTRIIRSWNAPPIGAADIALLQLASQLLGGGKTSRLYERLTFSEPLADSVSVGLEPLELASLFQLQVDVKAGVDPKQVEAAIAQEWQRFLDKGPTDQELKRAKIDVSAGFVRGIEKVGAKAAMFAEGQVYLDDPAAYRAELARFENATVASVVAAARRWLAQGGYTLTVMPYRQRSAQASQIDRSSGVPTVAQFPALTFPTIERGKLKNGVEVVLAQRHAIPTVQIDLRFDGGYAADVGRKLGTASFTAAMLDEGTATLDALQIARREQDLGAGIGVNSGLDSTHAKLDALKSQLEPSLVLLADIVRNPAFSTKDIERLRGQWLAGIAQEKTEPQQLALRVLPPLVYGAGHPYAIPMTGSGTEVSIASIGAEDLRQFHRDQIRPDNLRILVAGDTTLSEIVGELDRVFGDWKAPPTPLHKDPIAGVPLAAAPRVFLIDKPGAEQSMILAAEIAPSGKAPNYLEMSTMNGAFGGSFTSRLNMNLRENKHWSYGVGSLIGGAQGPRIFALYAPVQTDKTAQSLKEIGDELRAVLGPRPLTHEEIEKIKFNDVRELPGRFETSSAVLGALIEIVAYDRPDNHIATAKARIEAQTDEAVRAATREVIHPEALTWVIVGDLGKIESSVRALELGEVKVIDVNGAILR